MANNIETLAYIADKEKFRSKPYWDVNAWRIGFGSDTITKPDGSSVTIGNDKTKKPKVTITEEDAWRDLQRRVPEFQQNGIVKYVGADAWNALDGNTQAALTSLAYNYGSLAKLPSLVKAIKTGDKQQIADAVLNRAADNDKVNQWRRKEEAEIILGRPVPLGNVPTAVATQLDTTAVAPTGGLFSQSQLAAIRDPMAQRQPMDLSVAPLNLPRPKPIAQSGNPVFDINQTPRLNADGVAVYGNYPRDLNATDYGAARASLFNPSAPIGTTGAGTPRQVAPLTLANMPSSWYTGIPTPAPPVQNMVRPVLPTAGYPAAPAPVRQPSTMTPTAPTYQRPTGFNPYNPNGVNDVTNSYGRYVPGQPSGAIRNVTTQTVRQDGTVVTAPRAGTTALPANVRPNIAPIVTTPKPTSYGAGLSFPSGLGSYGTSTPVPVAPKPIKPLPTSIAGTWGAMAAPKPVVQSAYAPIPVYKPALPPAAPTGFGYTPIGSMPAAPKVAPIPQTRPTTTTTGVKPSSSGGSSSSSAAKPATAAPATFKGSSTGQTYVVGQKYTAGGYTYVAQPNGTFKKV